RQRESRVRAQPASVFRARGRVALARHADLEGKPLVERIDRPVAAKGYARTGRRQIARGLQVFEALRSQIILRAVEGVRRGLLPLEGQDRNGIQLPVTREVGGIHDLIVCDGGANRAPGKYLAQ